MSTTSASGLTGLSSSLLVLSSIAVTLRFWTRRRQKLDLKSDDWIMILCLFLFLGTTSTTFYGLNHKLLGYATPKDPKVAAERGQSESKLYLAFDLFSIATLACIKIGAVLFYRRIFCTHGRRSFFNALTIFTIVIISIWMVGYMMLSGLSCGTHFSALWTSHKAFTKYCQTAQRFLLSLSISDFLLDLWIMGLPIPQIWAIHSTVRRKIAVTGVFLLAFAGLGACIARMVIYIQIIYGTISILDPALLNTEPIYFTVLECGLSLIAVNLPSLSYLLSKTTPEQILHSVRSIMSLRSEHSAGAGSVQPSHHDKRSNSSSSDAHILQTDSPYMETHAMQDLEEKGRGTDLLHGKIQVTEPSSHTATRV